MSVDRGFLGKAPCIDKDGQYRSMDDLSANQKTKGLELVRLLRVMSKALCKSDTSITFSSFRKLKRVAMPLKISSPP